MKGPSTDWKESAPPGEAEEFERIAGKLRDLQRKRAKKTGAVARGLHAKGQLGLEAELTVLPDLPAHAKVGPFATPKTYRAYVRFSNGAGLRQSDRKPDVRGVAIKVVGVPGKKIIPGMEAAMTQDFLMVQTPSVPFANPDEFVWFVCAADNPLLLVPRAFFHLGPARAIRLIKQLAAGLSRPVVSLATSRYFSAAPTRFGAYAVRYSLRPHAAPDPAGAPGKTPDYLAEEMRARLAKGAVTYDLAVQFYVDEARTSIEDTTRAWSEDDAPPLTVARLIIPTQDPTSARGAKVAARIEAMSFDPWHALEELRPLGAMMRARNPGYRLSNQERGAAPEPDGSETFE